MRIISGKHKSRVLKTLEGMNTRPMIDRMKESVFNTIGPYFDSDIVLDLFGGSGALSLEALSRGCSKAYIVEKNHQACQVIKDNISSLKEEENCFLFETDYKIALKNFKEKNMTFDIIFLDPPYRLNIIDEIIEFIQSNNMLNDKGIIVCQYVRGNHQAQDSTYLKIIKNYSYASSEVCIYQKIAN